MKPLRIAHIPYLNSAPFYPDAHDDRLEMVDLHPRALGQAAAQGAVDAGLLSVADAFRSSQFEPLGDLGIALDGPAHSVLLFSARPVADLQGATLGISGETSTSYPLLRLLLGDRFGVHPAAYVRRPRGPLASDDGILLIGDAALRRAAHSGLEPDARDYADGLFELSAADPFEEPYRHVMDLAAVWNEWQGLPFVFARWMVHRSVSTEARGMLLGLLSETLDDNLRRLDTLAAEHGARTGLSPEGAFAYLMGFTYRFGARGETAIRTFHDLLQATSWWESAPPVVLQGEVS